MRKGIIMIPRMNRREKYLGLTLFLSVASGSGLTRSAVNRDQTCASRVDKSKMRLGGSDDNKQDGSAHNIESILETQ